MPRRKVAETPLDVAASTAGNTFQEWIDALPVAYRSAGDPERAEQLAGVLDEQIEDIRRVKADEA